MKKITKPFHFIFPLKKKIVRDLKIFSDHIGDLEVEGIGYFDPGASLLDIFERFAVDIDYIRWKGTDIRLVLETTGGLEEIEVAAIRHIAREFQTGISKAA